LGILSGRMAASVRCLEGWVPTPAAKDDGVGTERIATPKGTDPETAPNHRLQKKRYQEEGKQQKNFDSREKAKGYAQIMIYL